MDDASRRMTDTPDTDWAPSTSVDPGQPAASDEGTTRRTAELREEIEQTRAEMSETIEALQDRLTPAHLVAQASDTVKEAANRKVQEMAHSAEHMAEEVLDSSFVQSIRSNPVPAAMIAIGAGWLLMKRRSQPASYGATSSGRRDWRQAGGYKPSGAYGTSGGTSYAVGTTGSTQAGSAGGAYAGGEYGGEYGESRGAYGNYGSLSQVSSPGASTGGFERVVRDNPLALGAAAVLVGAAIGMSFPGSQAENKLMGEARDNVVEGAREMASTAADKIGDVAGQLQGAASQAAGGSTASSGSATGSSTGSGPVGGSATSGSNWDTASGGGSRAGGTDSTAGTDTKTPRRRPSGSSGL